VNVTVWTLSTAGECVAVVPYMFLSAERTCHTSRHIRCKQQHVLSQLGGENIVTFLAGLHRIMALAPNITLLQNVETLFGGAQCASFSVCTGVSPPPVGKAAVAWHNRSTTSSAGVRNEWSHTSSPPVRLHGVDMENFTFTPVQRCADSNKFGTLARNICVSSAWNLRHVTILAPRIYVMSPFWPPEFTSCHHFGPQNFHVTPRFWGGGGFERPCFDSEKFVSQTLCIL